MNRFVFVFIVFCHTITNKQISCDETISTFIGIFFRQFSQANKSLENNVNSIMLHYLCPGLLPHKAEFEFEEYNTKQEEYLQHQQKNYGLKSKKYLINALQLIDLEKMGVHCDSLE